MTNEIVIENIKEAKLILLCNNIVELIVVIDEGRKQGLYKNKFWDLDNDEELDLDKLKNIAIELVLKELEKQDNRIKELEADNYECNNIINDYIETVNIFNTMINLMLEEIVERKYIFGTIEQAEQYFENKAKESGEIDEG